MLAFIAYDSSADLFSRGAGGSGAARGGHTGGDGRDGLVEVLDRLRDPLEVVRSSSRVIEVLVEARQLGEVVSRRRLVLERVGARHRGVHPIEQRLLPLKAAGAVD